jgi:hypothetical protein
LREEKGIQNMSRGRRRLLVGLGAGVTVVVSFVAGARLTATGRVEQVSGQVTTKAELRRAIDRAHDDGHRDGYFEGQTDGRDAAEAEAEVAIEAAGKDNYERGRADGATAAYPVGFTAGCENVFDDLEAERVMNFDIFHNGGNWARYLERAGC